MDRTGCDQACCLCTRPHHRPARSRFSQPRPVKGETICQKRAHRSLFSDEKTETQNSLAWPFQHLGMSPSPMLPTSLGLELQQGGGGRVDSRKTGGRAGGMGATGPLHQLCLAPTRSVPSVLFRSTEEGLGDPSGAKLWHSDSGLGVLLSDPDLEDILIPSGQAGALRPSLAPWLPGSRGGLPMAGKFWAKPCSPEGQAGRKRPWVGVGAGAALSGICRALPGQVDPGSPPWLIADN